MKKSFFEYDVYIFDMDGTLYYQNKMRLIMLFNLIKYYIAHPLRVYEIYIILMYRILREKTSYADCENADGKIISTINKNGHYGEENIRRIIDYWMIQAPNKAVADSRDDLLSSIIGYLKNEGKMVIIYSDYPTELKCEALSVHPDYMYYPDGKNILFLKPNAQGLKTILKEHRFLKEQVIFVGDRDDKDGECARRCDVDYLILSGKYGKRRRQYKEVGINAQYWQR